MNEKKIYIGSIISLAIGYAFYIGLIVHSYIFRGQYEGLNFISKIDEMYYVSLIWLIGGVIGLVGFSYLIYKHQNKKVTYLYLSLCLVPVVILGISIVE